LPAVGGAREAVQSVEALGSDAASLDQTNLVDDDDHDGATAPTPRRPDREDHPPTARRPRRRPAAVRGARVVPPSQPGRE